MEIKRKNGSRVSTPAAEVHGELERIRDGKPLILQSVIDESKPKKSVLHGEFEWRNAIAGNNWRLYEARKIVQSVEIIEEKTRKPFRAYESIIIETDGDDDDEKTTVRSFLPVEEIMADPDLRDELLGRAIRDVLALKRRYSNLQEMAQVFAAMDEFLMTANP